MKRILFPLIFFLALSLNAFASDVIIIPLGGPTAASSIAKTGVFGAAVEVTIASGVAAKGVAGRNLLIDTEADAASDDLDDITGYSDGDMIIIGPANDARTVVVKDSATMNLSGVDFTMDAINDSMTLLNKGSDTWKELSRAAN